MDGSQEVADAGTWDLAPWDRMFAFICSDEFGAQFPGTPVNWSIKWEDQPELMPEFDVVPGGARKKGVDGTGGVAFAAKLGRARTSKYNTFANFLKAVAKARSDQGATSPAVVSLDDVKLVWSNEAASKEEATSIGGIGRGLKSERITKRNPAKMQALKEEYDEIGEAILLANETKLKNLARARKPSKPVPRDEPEEDAPKKSPKKPTKKPAAPKPEKVEKTEKTEKPVKQPTQKRKREETTEPAAEEPRKKRAAAKKAEAKVKEAVKADPTGKREKVDPRAMVVEFFDRIGDEMKAFAATFDQLGDVDMDEDVHVGDSFVPGDESDSDSDPDALGTADLTPESGSEEEEEDDDVDPYANATFCDDECDELKENADDDDSSSDDSNEKAVDDDENTVFAAPSKKSSKPAAKPVKEKPAATKKTAPAKPTEPKPQQPKKQPEAKQQPKKADAPKPAATKPAEPKKTAPPPAKKPAGETQKPPGNAKQPTQKAPQAKPGLVGAAGPLVMPSQLNGGSSISDVIAGAPNSMVTVVDWD